MQSLQERVAYLEGRAEDISAFRPEVGQRFDRIDAQFDRIDAQFDRVDAKFVRVDAKFERLEAKVDDHFKWLVGIQVTSLLVIFGAIIGLYFK